MALSTQNFFTMTLLCLALLFAIIIVLNFSNFQRYRRIKRWRNQLNLSVHHQSFFKLYQPVDGYTLSTQARINNDAIEYVYGEIMFEPFIALLSLCKPDSNCVFYDLGSGTGKAVLACAMVFDVRRCYGIELFNSLHLAAINQRYLLAEKNYRQQAEKITFINANFLTVPVLDATLVFINSTLFIGSLWQQISRYLEQLSENSLVISTSRPVYSTCFETERTTDLCMSFGIVSVYIQRRLAT